VQQTVDWAWGTAAKLEAAAKRQGDFGVLAGRAIKRGLLKAPTLIGSRRWSVSANGGSPTEKGGTPFGHNIRASTDFFNRSCRSRLRNSLARPGGDTTGFVTFEYSISGKWLDLLKKLAPQTRRVAVLRDPSDAAGIGQFAVIQSAASSSGIELSAIDSRDVNEIERGLAAFGREPNGGVIVAGTASAAAHRKLIISLATRYHVPNIYPYRYYSADGGLASYGPDTMETFKRAAEYVDRILKGAKPSELPVQTPTKYELVLNLKAAEAIGLEIPTSLLTTADEVIE
jgi:ABC-type uncharacterized transport system substrate-binding protein